MAIITTPGTAVSTGSGSVGGVRTHLSKEIYGRTIPISSGQRGIYATPLWLTAPRQVTVIDSVTDIEIGTFGGGLEGGQKVLSHTNLVIDFMVALGYHLAPVDEREETAVLRVWVNEKLVFDASDPTVTDPNIHMTFHDGAFDQDADPTMLSSLAGLSPPQPCPAYRNMIYLVFKDFVVYSVSSTNIPPENGGPIGGGAGTVPVGAYTIPLVRVELVDGLTITTEEHSFEMLPDGTINENGMVLDWANDTAYAFSGISGDTTSMRTFAIGDEVELGSVPVTGTYSNLIGLEFTWGFDPVSGCVVAAKDGVANTSPIVSIDLSSGAIVDTFGEGRTNIEPSDVDGNNSKDTGKPNTSFPFPIKGDLVMLNDGASTNSVWAFGTTFYSFCLLQLDQAGGFVAPKGSTVSAPVLTSYTLGAPAQQAKVSDFPSALRFADGDAVSFVTHIPFIENGVHGASGQDGAVIIGVGQKVYAVYIGIRNGKVGILGLALGYDFGAGHTAAMGLIDPKDKGLVVFERASGSGNWTATKFRDLWLQSLTPGLGLSTMEWRGLFPTGGGGIGSTDLDVVWSEPIPDMNSTSGSQLSMRAGRFDGGSYVWHNILGTHVLSLSTGKTETLAFHPGITGDFAWDSSSHKLYYPSAGLAVHERDLYVSAVTAAAGESKTIGDYLKWLAMYKGRFAEADIYVDPQLTDPVIGALIDRPFDIGKLFADLGLVYDFQYFESGGKARFVRAARGDGAPDPQFDLALDDLAPVNENNLTEADLLVSVLAEPGRLAANVGVNYDDFDQSYMWLTATYTGDKQSSGDTGVGSMTIDTPMVMHRAEAYKRASQVAIRQNATADMHFFRLAQKYLRLEPSDVVTVTLPPFRYAIRIDEGTLNADYTISLSGVNYSFQDDIPEPADSHTGLSDPTLGTGDAKPMAFDMPLIGPSFNGITGFVVMVAVRSYGQANYTGTTLYAGELSPVSEPLTPIGDFVGSATWGTTFSALPATTTPFTTDNDTEVTVSLRTGTSDDFDSTDADGLLAGDNAIIVGEAGRYELVFFRDVEVVNAKVVRLTGLLRGRRGTDTFTDLHAVGDSVTLLRSVATDFVPTLQPQRLLAASMDTVERYIAHGLDPVRPLIKLDLPIEGQSAFPWTPAEPRARLGSGLNNVAAPDYTNPLGGGTTVAPSGINRDNAITVTSNYGDAGLTFGAYENGVDGDDTANATHSFALVGGLTDFTITFDFRPYGIPQRITAFVWQQNTTSNQGTYDVEASNDGAVWTSLASAQDIVSGAVAHETTFTNPDGYLLYRLVQAGGTTSATPWIREIYFKTHSIIGVNDLYITWLRRDRLAEGEFVTDDVLMSEESEEYELEIYDGVTLVRTVTGLTTPTYTYEAADQATDGFTPPLASLSVRIYQVSGVTGRGFPRTITLDVA